MNNIINYEQIIDSVAMGIFTIDMDWNITFFNSEAEKITGFTKEEALGRKCYEVFRSELCFKECYLNRAIKGHIKIFKGRNQILNKHNQEVPVDITATALTDDAGTIIGGVESFIDDSMRVELEKEIEQSYTFYDIIGRDQKIVNLFDIVSVVAPTDANVMILGETGSGKDLFARATHNSSHRKNGPFVKVNCPALPDTLLESELFGYVRGAFTDAKHTKRGRFQMADTGTIFLDEIGDLSKEIQTKLLQVLDEQEFYPLGATEPVNVDVRVIASTNQDLSEMVRSGKFRRDLYYRLKVVELTIPSLRERREDIALLIDHFLTKQAKVMGKKPFRLNPDVMKILLNYEYPGNVRELKHIIEHTTILCRKSEIGVDDLPDYLTKQSGHERSIYESADLQSINAYVSKKEKQIILEVLTMHGWHREKAAKALNIDRTTLWRKIKRHGLIPYQ
ncbi:MAG: sigma 54-interacting transcriptional regulator [Deltaproteobacteria bacterium]|nr:sigma 54-interacting transcriptional regulator [Deltaproteobacteria bacterium]